MKLTPIFPAHIKPVRVGVYRATSGSDRYVDNYAYWNGCYWSAEQFTAQAALATKHLKASFQNKRWQGVAR